MRSRGYSEFHDFFVITAMWVCATVCGGALAVGEVHPPAAVAVDGRTDPSHGPQSTAASGCRVYF